VTEWAFESGRRYRVTQEFKDYDGDVHPVGEEWTFRRQSFLPYEDGMSWFVSPDNMRERHIRMQWREGQQKPILDDLGQYFSAGELAEAVAQYRFKFTDSFRMEATRKYQRARGGVLPEHSGMIGLIILAMGVLGGALDQFWFMVPCVIVAGLSLLMWWMRGPSMRRKFRSSPYRNDDVMVLLSDTGVQITGLQSEMRLSWPLVTKAIRFADGLLLFQGPNVFNWLPDYAATTPQGIPEAIRLVMKHVRNFRDA
jgi:hypothetical protein